MNRRRVACVIQRYGLEVNGGAELLCRWTAEHLNRHVDVEVITTCAVDYERWSNVYPPGPSEVNGVAVRRFKVDRARDLRRFDQITRQVLSDTAGLDDQLEWMRQQGPLSSGLLRYLASERDRFDAFIFFTYLYATTFLGLPLVKDKAVLVPMAHDDPFIRLDIFRSLFEWPKFMAFLTAAEQRLVRRVFDDGGAVPSSVVGTGIDVPDEVRGDRFREKHGLRGEFVVYAGRIDESKNVQELFDFFLSFRAGYAGNLKLVVMGKGTYPIPRHPDIVPLGFISEEDKFDGLQAASVLILPSRYESLSIAVLEAWRVGTPALVNGVCDVLKEQCRAGRGGLWYQSREEFAVALTALLQQPELRRRLALSGREYAGTTYAWDRVVTSYLDALERLESFHTARLPSA
jgi:glycosyltransferase involved in cell wall biosynthesis